MTVYVYACNGNTYETHMPAASATLLIPATPATEYGTCQEGFGAWLVYEKETVNLEMIQLALAAACVLCVALGWMSGSQR